MGCCRSSPWGTTVAYRNRKLTSQGTDPVQPSLPDAPVWAWDGSRCIRQDQVSGQGTAVQVPTPPARTLALEIERMATTQLPRRQMIPTLQGPGESRTRGWQWGPWREGRPGGCHLVQRGIGDWTDGTLGGGASGDTGTFLGAQAKRGRAPLPCPGCQWAGCNVGTGEGVPGPRGTKQGVSSV